MLASYVDLLAAYDFGGERVGNSLIVREPAGVVGAITPWNYPLHQIVAKVGRALAAGCTVVLKPSEVAPLAAYELADIFHETGLPPACSTWSAATARSSARPSPLTRASTWCPSPVPARAGTRVAEVAAATVKRVTLELGGKSANVILPDADLAKAVKVGVAKAFANSGQTCNALTRMLVHRDAATTRPWRWRPRTPARYDRRPDGRGHPARPAGLRGPARPGPRLHRARASPRAPGSSPAAPSRRDGPGHGLLRQPTVFADVTPGMTIAQEEIFGPVLSIIAYDDRGRGASRSPTARPTAWPAAVWSADQEQAVAFARRLRAGQVEINGGAFNPAAPFGGFGASGYGRELGVHGLEEFLEIKAAAVLNRPIWHTFSVRVYLGRTTPASS